MNTQKEIFNAKLESIKAQLEDLTKEFEEFRNIQISKS